MTTTATATKEGAEEKDEKKEEDLAFARLRDYHTTSIGAGKLLRGSFHRRHFSLSLSLPPSLPPSLSFARESFGASGLFSH